jgi:Holin of 3TMs, for gene-transfer release
MDWSDLAKQVVSLGAPMLGTALGGPLGGVAGEILARAVGSVTLTPAAVQSALPAVDPAKLAEAEAQWAQMMQAEAETQRTAIAETQQTIRAEIASDDVVQRWWRPLSAGELTLECAALWLVLIHEFWTGDIQTINALVGATTLLVAYWGFRFGVLGVYISGRTREKVSAVTGMDAPGIIEKLVKAVVKKK